MATTVRHRTTVRSTVPLANANVQAIKTRIEAFLGALAEADMGLTTGQATLGEGSTTTIAWGNPNCEVSTTFAFDGTWTKT